ncbi:TniQ family protein [Streptomyces malaysiensis]|uniref:TniQ family protein n=1 Tax=Streptomyces malaysiensis TaxID=92644 RepID=UPI000853C11D|nr:TniQ family protein [Streptomyces sp. SPMA113]
MTPNGSAPVPITADALPLRVPLIHGETTLSFLHRTATANGRELPKLLGALVDTGLKAPEEGGPAPHREEVLLPAEGIARLAALVQREPEQLARALPSTHPARLADTETARIEPWPKELGAGPLPACPLCMEPGAWLAAAGHRWRPCPCGRRWMAGDDGGYTVDTGPVPDLGRALNAHRALVHRLGPLGDALLADAHQVMLWWWVSIPRRRGPGRDRGTGVATVWQEREDALGMTRHRRRAAPVVVYPEAVTLAELMWKWEERRRKRGAVAEAWVEDVVAQLVPAGALSRQERTPLDYWLEQHRAEPTGKPKGRTGAERRWNRLPALHRRPTEPGPFRASSCLMWVYGLPLTATTAVCPRCNGRAPSCRWVPYSECTGRPKR